MPCRYQWWCQGLTWCCGAHLPCPHARSRAEFLCSLPCLMHKKVCIICTAYRTVAVVSCILHPPNVLRLVAVHSIHSAWGRP